MDKRKILLVAVNARYIHSCPAVYSLKAYADQYKRSDAVIEIAEYAINDRYEEILSDVMGRQSDVVAFSTYIWNVDRVLRLISDIRRIRENRISIWAGGPECTNAPMRFLMSKEQDGEEERLADVCLLGEGEQIFTELTDQTCLGTGTLEDIHGLAYLNNGNLCLTPPADLVEIDKIPFLYRDLSLFDNRIIYYESSRGCPFRCSYCLSSIDKRVRLRNIDVVKRELLFFLEQGVRQVKFVDRTFNLNHAHAGAVWQFIREHDNGITNFHFEIEAALLTEEELDFLETLRPGLIQMEIGVQSVREETLRLVNRKAEIDKIEHAVSRLRRRENINLHLDLIAGLPGEGFEDFKQSFNRVYAMHADQFQLGFLKVLKGTEMERRRREFGIIASASSPYQVLKTKWLSFEELVMLERISDMIELFYNSRFFIRSLPVIESLFETPFVLYQVLSEFFVRKGYHIRQPSAQKRYEVMEEFVKEWLSVSHRGKELFPDDRERTEEMLLVIRNYLAFDKALHFNKSRHMECTETFSFPEGKKTLRFDYRRRNPVNGEAAYEVVS